MGVWTNADKPEEAALARSYGAQGIGLCRTEHMFREGERLEIVRDAILVANVATRAKARLAAGETLDADDAAAVARFDAAMAKLEVLQQGDFEGIFRAMDGLPVVVRLIDPPLHEFLPNHDDLLVEVTEYRVKGTPDERPGYARAREVLAVVESMHEQNPMLGLRGCRLGLMIPDFVKIQTRAILNAQIAVKKAGGNPIAKIMIPLVGHVNELSATKALLEAEAKAVEAKAGVDVDYKFGTMIEVPRGALTADEIARDAAFFSFGTNDLTQMTFGYSRDDAEGGFLLKYVEEQDPAGQPVPDPRRRGRRADEDRRRQGPGDPPGPRARDLRRARRRPGVDLQVREDRARLRVVLAVPRPGRPAGRGAGRPGRTPPSATSRPDADVGAAEPVTGQASRASSSTRRRSGTTATTGCCGPARSSAGSATRSPGSPCRTRSTS